jgi:hypothetical protein
MPSLAEQMAAKQRGDEQQKERNRILKNQKQAEYYQANKEERLVKQKEYRKRTGKYDSYKN